MGRKYLLQMMGVYAFVHLSAEGFIDLYLSVLVLGSVLYLSLLGPVPRLGTSVC